MNALLKKISAGILLAALLVPFSIIFLFQARQSAIQLRMKKQLQANLLHDLVLPQKDLHWVKPGKEILVEGKMFDIKTIRYQHNGTVYITGLFDHEETVLYQQLKKNRQEENAGKNQQVLHFFQLMQAVPGNPPETGRIPDPLVLHRPQAATALLPAPFHTLLTPPPQC